MRRIFPAVAAITLLVITADSVPLSARSGDRTRSSPLAVDSNRRARSPQADFAAGEAASGCSGSSVQGGSIGTAALSSAERAQVHAAMQEWNAKSATSKVTFVDDDGWWGTDINIEPSSSIGDDACGEWDADDDTIRLHENLLASVNNHPEQTKSTVGHELAHFLGLGHGALNQSNITSTTSQSCADDGFLQRPERTVTDDDAASARTCIDQKTDPNHSFPSTEPAQQSEFAYEEPPYTCYEVTLWHTYWRKDSQGNWYIYHQWPQYLGILCIQ